MKRTIIKVMTKSFNDFTFKLREMLIWDVTVQVAGMRYRFVDNVTGVVVAMYDERKDHGLVYNYNLGR